MSSQKYFRLRNPALMISLAAMCPAISLAAGTASVDFAAGAVTAVDAAGVSRSLAKGAAIGNGDTIRTGADGRAQLRFSDGAMVSLLSETDFRIDDYRYEGRRGGEEKGFFSLLKGGLRTITGWVGRSQRENYRVTTSVATIGIRGTEYKAQLSPAGDELQVATGEGLVEICGAGGCLLLASGESGVVRGDGPPRRTEVRAGRPTEAAASSAPVYSVVEQKTSAGEVNLQALTTGGGAGLPSVLGIAGVAGAQTRDGATLTLNGDGSLNSFVSGGLTTGQGSASVFESGNDGVIGWGRWAGGQVVVDGSPVSLTTDQGLHHVWGVPTPVMPASGTATYSTVVGATNPTNTTGTLAPGLLTSAALTANFGTGSVSATVGVTIGPTGPANNFVVSGMGSIGGNGFSITGMSGTGGGCATGCTGEVSGRFFGSSAERVGLVYKITEFGGGMKIIGAAALKQ